MVSVVVWQAGWALIWLGLAVPWLTWWTMGWGVVALGGRSPWVLTGIVGVLTSVAAPLDSLAWCLKWLGPVGYLACVPAPGRSRLWTTSVWLLTAVTLVALVPYLVGLGQGQSFSHTYSVMVQTHDPLMRTTGLGRAAMVLGLVALLRRRWALALAWLLVVSLCDSRGAWLMLVSLCVWPRDAR